MSTAKVTQRDYMRRLAAKHGRHAELVCRDYVSAEAAGLVYRASRGRTPEQYAAALFPARRDFPATQCFGRPIHLTLEDQA